MKAIRLKCFKCGGVVRPRRRETIEDVNIATLYGAKWRMECDECGLKTKEYGELVLAKGAWLAKEKPVSPAWQMLNATPKPTSTEEPEAPRVPFASITTEPKAPFEKQEGERRCGTCAHFSASLSYEPCLSCYPHLGYRGWEPRVPRVSKTPEPSILSEAAEPSRCATCRHESKLFCEEPCRSCSSGGNGVSFARANGFPNWEPRHEQKAPKAPSISETPRASILDEAASLVAGDRNADYGDCVADYTDVAVLWSVILGHEVSARQAALCMCAVKLRREAHRHKRDNLVDLCGYAEIAQRCAEKEWE